MALNGLCVLMCLSASVHSLNTMLADYNMQIMVLRLKNNFQRVVTAVAMVKRPLLGENVVNVRGSMQYISTKKWTNQ